MINTIVKQAEQIEYANTLPPKEGCMLLDGDKYTTGSDYSESMLSTPIMDIEDANYSN